MSRKVNLDAIIHREDFEISDGIRQGIGYAKDTVSINDLKKGEFFFSFLRKPDFQRETNEWDSNKVINLIHSFLEDDLIPAIILWRSASGYIFVIDGSHRLSALAAWINDDYGDGKISKLFYDGIISEDQIKIAEETRRIIKKRIGSFDDHQRAIEKPESVSPEILNRAKRMGALAIQLQWVYGDASKAEDSFFKINQQASPIDQTELRVLQARKKPNGIAARAIVRSGKGHKYWSAFQQEVQDEIQIISKRVNELLFTPPLDTPIKTLDIPIGGKVYAAQSLPLVLDFINIVNNEKDKDQIPEDLDGSLTIKYLKTCRTILERINSNHPGSLGLHPAVYFYSSNGRHKPASFYAVAALILEMERQDLYRIFTDVRSQFEEMLIKYDYFTQQIVRHYRGAVPSYSAIKDFYMRCIMGLKEGKTPEEVIAEIINDPSFKFLTHTKSEIEISSQDFDTDRKSEVFIKEALRTGAIVRCSICNGFMHSNSISIDHIKRKQDGGTGSVENGQIAHFYCNTTYKN